MRCVTDFDSPCPGPRAWPRPPNHGHASTPACHGGLLLAGLAVLAIAVLLPVALVAGAIGAGALWWRIRRARRDGTVPQGVRFVIIKR